MNYLIWIDNQGAGPFGLDQLVELYLNEIITATTKVRIDSEDPAEPWQSLGEMFPSIAALPTRRAQQSMLSHVASSPQTGHRVVVTDFDMGFGSMIVFMIKWAIASIPAAIILFVLGAILTAIFSGALAGLMAAVLQGGSR